VNVLKCILVQKVGFLKYKSGLLHGHNWKPVNHVYSSHYNTSGPEFPHFQKVNTHNTAYNFKSVLINITMWKCAEVFYITHIKYKKKKSKGWYVQ